MTGDVEIGDDAATTRAVTVSKITGEWYAGDFGRDDEERLRALAGFVPENGDVGRAIAKVLDAGGGAHRRSDWRRANTIGRSTETLDCEREERNDAYYMRPARARRFP